MKRFTTLFFVDMAKIEGRGVKTRRVFFYFLQISLGMGVFFGHECTNDFYILGINRGYAVGESLGRKGYFNALCF